MHQLDRTAIPAPACLNRYQPDQNTWGDLSDAAREEIQSSLKSLQGTCCAYCEGDLDTLGKHIEHFRQRGRFSQGTFDWNNLFWSCNRQDSCGKHKDRCQYDHTEIIKPDVDDPERFFLFVADGSIRVRTGLNQNERRRAHETLRVFNLDEQRGRLRKMRQGAAIGYIRTAQEIQEIAAICTYAEWMPFLEQELAYVRNLPFATTIKHVLTPQGTNP